MVFRKKTKKAPETFHFEEREGTTGWGEEMRNLTHEILNSFDARVTGVKALKHATAAMLKGFRDEMKNVQLELRRKAAVLKRFLSNAEASRMKDFRAMHQGIRTRQEERSRELAATLGDFRRESGAAASHWQHMAAAMAKKRASFAR